MRSEKVNFYSEGIKLAGVLYLPDGEQGKPYPGIVQGPGFGLKDAKHYTYDYNRALTPSPDLPFSQVMLGPPDLRISWCAARGGPTRSKQCGKGLSETLPFSCPFSATKSSKRQQVAAQSEGQNFRSLAATTHDPAASSTPRQRAANASFSAC